MASCEVLTFKNAEITYVDISYSSAKECMKIIDENQEIARQKPINSILTLVNVKKAEITPVLINKIVKTMRKNNPHVLATAVIGLSAFQRVILDTVVSLTGRNVAVLDNFIEAQLWLYDQYKRKAAIEI